MEQRRTIVFIDALFCLVLLPLTLMLQPLERWFERYTLFTVLLIAFLYLMYFIIRFTHLPRLVMKRHYTVALLVFALFFAAGSFLSNIPFPDNLEYIMPVEVRAHLRRRTVWLLILVVAGFGLSVELLLELFGQTISRRDIQSAKNRAELALYKAQIRPHFMFNTLNSIYSLVVSKSDKAEQAFVKFTDMLQYMYRHATDETVDIRAELEYISRYIELQTLRLNHHTRVVWEKQVDDEETQIPPMILMTFVENAFKYGTSPSVDCEIEIRISLQAGRLRFTTRNTVMRTPDRRDDPVGIENCRSRLELLYPNRFTLDTVEKNNQFNVTLTIHLP